jgi:hypothetical protein
VPEERQPKEPKTTPETPVPDPEQVWERFERLTRKVVRVPKSAIEKRKKDKPPLQS